MYRVWHNKRAANKIGSNSVKKQKTNRDGTCIYKSFVLEILL